MTTNKRWPQYNQHRLLMARGPIPTLTEIQESKNDWLMTTANDHKKNIIVFLWGK